MGMTAHANKRKKITKLNGQHKSLKYASIAFFSQIDIMKKRGTASHRGDDRCCA
jgi:hypothetical protein